MKQWLRQREDWLLFVAIWMFVALLFTHNATLAPKKFLILEEVVSVIFFGVWSLYSWVAAMEDSPYVLALFICRWLWILNAISCFMHSIFLFLVIFN